MNSTITLILILFCTLIVVYVLFKFLKSEASKTDKGTKLKGAAAGFVVIFGLVMTAYTQLAKSIPLSQHQEIIEQFQLEKWTITADIKKEGDSTFSGIVAIYDPPKPIVYIDKVNEKIILSDVLICRYLGYPKVNIGCEGYYSYPLEISENNDDYLIDKKNKTIHYLPLIRLERKDDYQ